jgi:AcrR family transcriptional regulator
MAPRNTSHNSPTDDATPPSHNTGAPLTLTFFPVGAPTGDAMPGDSRHERSDAAENRRRILREAERLFTEHGVDAVAMQDIARAAGVGQGTLYRRFANKGELCLAMLDTQMADFQNEVFATLRTMTAHGETKFAQLIWFFDALIQFAERHAPMLCAAGREANGPVTMSRDSSPFVWQRLTVTGLLQTGMARREFRADIDAQATAELLLTMLFPPAFQTMRAGGLSLERITNTVRHIIEGLQPRR